MHKPILQSLILADHVYEDKLTGKRIIAGVFNRIIRSKRLIKQFTPLTETPPEAPPAPAFSQPQPAESNPPVQVQAPLFVQPGQSIETPTQPTLPPPLAPSPVAPSLPSAAPAQQPPVAPAPQESVSPTSAPQSVAPSIPQASAPQPLAAQATPAQASIPPAPTPPAPAQLPLQPVAPPPPSNQRMLEIPPTGLQSGSPFAYLSLTEVRGVTPLLLQFINLEDNMEIFRSEIKVDCPNPLYTIELTVPLPPLSPPQAGIYALELLYNYETLGSLRIVVEDAP
jgi:hypothetical protein